MGSVRKGLKGRAVLLREAGFAVDKVQALLDFQASSFFDAFEALLDKPAFFFALSQKIPEMFGSRLDPLQVSSHLLLLLIGEIGDLFFDIVHKVHELVGAQAFSEIGCRNIFQGVSFIKDNRLETRDDLSKALFLDHEVGEEEVMVHDDELGLCGSLAEAVEEAILIEHAVGPHTLIGSGRDGIPQRVLVLEPVQFRTIPKFRTAYPLLKGGPEVLRLLFQQERSQEVLIVAIKAQIILSAFHHHGIDLPAERSGEERNIL